MNNVPRRCVETHLKVPAPPLLFLDRDEQSFEVSFTETFTSFALEDLVEDGRAIFDGFGEDLEQVAFVVAVDEDAEFFQFVYAFVDLAYAVGELFIIRVRHA